MVHGQTDGVALPVLFVLVFCLDGERCALGQEKLQEVSDVNEVQQRVKAIREQRGLSQSALARESGLSFSTVSMIERGLRTPSLAALTALAEALDADPGEFLPKAHGAGESLELVEARRALSWEEFRDSLEGLGLGTLNDLGRALAA